MSNDASVNVSRRTGKTAGYHGDADVQVEIARVVRVDVALLPVPAVVRDLVQLVVQVRRVKVLRVHQVAPVSPKNPNHQPSLKRQSCIIPVQSVGDVEVDVAVAQVRAEGHVGIEQVINIGRLCFLIVDDVSVNKILKSNGKN